MKLWALETCIFFMSATMICTKVKISKMCLSGLAEIALLKSFLYIISAIFFVIKLAVFMLTYIFSNIALILKRQKILLLSFLFRLLGNLLEFPWWPHELKNWNPRYSRTFKDNFLFFPVQLNGKFKMGNSSSKKTASL